MPFIIICFVICVFHAEQHRVQQRCNILLYFVLFQIHENEVGGSSIIWVFPLVIAD